MRKYSVRFGGGPGEKAAMTSLAVYPTMFLATVASARILLHVGHLTERDWTEVQARLRMVFM